MGQDENKVKYLWEALENFSNEDRSRFVRFVTGRRRLPAQIHVFSGSVGIIFRVGSAVIWFLMVTKIHNLMTTSGYCYWLLVFTFCFSVSICFFSYLYLK